MTLQDKMEAINKERRLRALVLIILQRAKEAGIPEDFLRIPKDEFKKIISPSYAKSNKTTIDEIANLIYDNTEEFIKEFQDKVDINIYNKVNKVKTKSQKIKEMKKYAEKHNLKFDGKYLYAFREHDQFGRGMFIKTIFYETGKYYKDWHCDMRNNEENSFGLGIWPKGNTKVRVKIEDWGCEVNRNDGKCRVLGFQIV